MKWDTPDWRAEGVLDAACRRRGENGTSTYICIKTHAVRNIFRATLSSL